MSRWTVRFRTGPGPAARAWAVAARALSLAAVLLGAAACGETIAEGALEISAEGTVRGGVFVDVNGNGVFDGLVDVALEGLTVQVRPPGTTGAVASGATDETGTYVIDGVPVGRFTLGIANSTLPDSLEVQGLPASPFLVAAGDTITHTFRAAFPTVPLGQVASLEEGSRIFTSGFVLNPRNPAGDGAVHLTLGGSYLRATGVEPVTIAVGDSVRFSGVTGIEAGLPVLTDVRVFVLRQLASIPAPQVRSTAVAATAEGGTLNAALARIQQADVIDTTFVNGDMIATVDDGSGPLDLVFRSFLGVNTDPLSPGLARVTTATGLLVAEPQEGGGVAWRLLPRFPSDVTVESFPLRTVAEARGLAAGFGVTLRGVVVSPVDSPIAGTIHIEEDGSYIRVRGVTGVAPAVGDTIQVRARTARSVQQPVADAVLPPEVRGTGPVSPPQLIGGALATLTASQANGGGADAALIRLQNVPIVATIPDDGAGNFIAVLDDGSGEVDLVITSASGVPTAGLVPAAILSDAIGVLIPRLDLGVPEWRIFPRFAADVVVAP